MNFSMNSRKNCYSERKEDLQIDDLLNKEKQQHSSPSQKCQLHLTAHLAQNFVFIQPNLCTKLSCPAQSLKSRELMISVSSFPAVCESAPALGFNIISVSSFPAVCESAPALGFNINPFPGKQFFATKDA
jgi:hypothetical protein